MGEAGNAGRKAQGLAGSQFSSGAGGGWSLPCGCQQCWARGVSSVHPSTPKLGAAAGGGGAGNQHEQVWLAAPSPRGNKDSVSGLDVFQRRARLGSAEGFAGGVKGLGSACVPSLAARRVWSVASCRQVHGMGLIYICRRHEGEDEARRAVQGREGRAERIFSMDPWLLQSRKDAF